MTAPPRRRDRRPAAWAAVAVTFLIGPLGVAVAQAPPVPADPSPGPTVAEEITPGTGDVGDPIAGEPLAGQNTALGGPDLPHVREHVIEQMTAGRHEPVWEADGLTYLVSRTHPTPDEAGDQLLERVEAHVTEAIFDATGTRVLADRTDLSLADLHSRRIVTHPAPQVVRYAGLYRAFVGVREDVLRTEIRTRQQVARLAWVWMFGLTTLVVLGVWSAYFRVRRFAHRQHDASLRRAAWLVTLGVFAVMVAVSRMLPELV